MTFDKDLFGLDFPPQVFDYTTIRADIENLLSKKFNKDEIEKIMFKNVYNKLFRRNEKW